MGALKIFEKNLKFVALPDPEIIRGYPKVCSPWIRAHVPFSAKFLRALFGWTL